MKTKEKREEARDVVLWRQIIEAVKPESIKTCQQQCLGCFVCEFSYVLVWETSLWLPSLMSFQILIRASFKFKSRTFAALTLTHFHPLSPAIWDLWSIMFANPQFELCNYVNTVIFASMLWNFMTRALSSWVNLIIISMDALLVENDSFSVSFSPHWGVIYCV